MKKRKRPLQKERTSAPGPGAASQPPAVGCAPLCSRGVHVVGYLLGIRPDSLRTAARSRASGHKFLSNRCTIALYG